MNDTTTLEGVRAEGREDRRRLKALLEVVELKAKAGQPERRTLEVWEQELKAMQQMQALSDLTDSLTVGLRLSGAVPAKKPEAAKAKAPQAKKAPRKPGNGSS